MHCGDTVVFNPRWRNRDSQISDLTRPRSLQAGTHHRPSFPFSFVMPASEDDFINDASDDDGEVRGPSRRKRAAARKTKGTDFEVTRTWEQLQEAADGTITSAVEGLLEAGKRKR
jgi:hypothetical protein